MLATPPWNSDGARHTARLLAVIWLYWAFSATLLKNSSRCCSTSRCSSGSRSTADCTASGRTSGGRSAMFIKCQLVKFPYHFKHLNLRRKMATKVSDILAVSSMSGNSRKYCLTISATSYACCISYTDSESSTGDSSTNVFSLAMRDLTPDFRNIPIYETFEQIYSALSHMNICLMRLPDPWRSTLAT